MTSSKPPNRRAGLSSKGLAEGKVGTLSGAILGISSVAPGYTLTASIGVIVAAVGLKMPAIFIAGFIPMFLTAYAYRELNYRAPDCGASFTWSTKAFGPYVGWMCGWGMVIATIIVLSNLAAIAVEFFYLFIAQVVNNPVIADLAANKPINIVTTLAFLALATWMASRGITTSEHLQYVLVGFQMVVLLAFAIVAIGPRGRRRRPGRVDLRPRLVQPVHRSGAWARSSSVVTGSIFAFWGWDTCLTLGEESKNPTKTPGRAGLLCVTTILLTYLLVAVAVMMYAGVGEDRPRSRQRGQLRQRLRRTGRPGAGQLGRDAALPGSAGLFGGQPADHVPARRTSDARDGRLRSIPQEVRRGPPAIPGAVVQHHRGRRGHRRVLHRGHVALRIGAAATPSPPSAS